MAGGAISPSRGPVASAELYDAKTGMWETAGQMGVWRAWHTATLLWSGKVLVAGGVAENSWCLDTAEIYDPVGNIWQGAGRMEATRYGHTSTMLPDGKVLVAGGKTMGNVQETPVEKFNPTISAWKTAAQMITPRFWHTATVLPDEKVLAAGGVDLKPYSTVLASAEIYDPSRDAWHGIGSMTVGRYAHTATLLSDGKVLVTGGETGQGGGTFLDTVEVYDPSADLWLSTGKMSTPRAIHTATLLPNGKVLVSSGRNGFTFPSSADLYDPFSGTWEPAGYPHGAEHFTTTLLPDGRALRVGGWDDNPVYSAELYDEGRSASPLSAPALDDPLPRAVQGDLLLLTGKGFAGVSEASGGNTAASPTNYPFLSLSHAENGAGTYQTVTSWTETSVAATLPQRIQPGWYWARVTTNAVPGAAKAIFVDFGYSCTPLQCEASSVPNGKDCTVAYTPRGTRCDDADACTIDDSCDGTGSCMGIRFPCSSDECVTSVCDGMGGCIVSSVARDGTLCGPKGGFCKEGRCRAGRCVIMDSLAGTICDDGDECTSGDICGGNGSCVGVTIPGCSTDAGTDGNQEVPENGDGDGAKDVADASDVDLADDGGHRYDTGWLQHDGRIPLDSTDSFEIENMGCGCNAVEVK
ncbi:MAG: hypothetical protein HY897_06515 [Deltaproteobacteria bacterium]|nr:hypothetical protein [Deltaproteobacteria bacterium]